MWLLPLENPSTIVTTRLQVLLQFWSPHDYCVEKNFTKKKEEKNLRNTRLADLAPSLICFPGFPTMSTREVAIHDAQVKEIGANK